MHEVQNVGNHLKLEGTVSLKKSNAMSTQSENMFEITAQIIELDNRTIHPNRAIRANLNDDGIRMYEGNLRTCFLGQARLESRLPVRNDHENDQQHEQNIDERNHVYIRDDSAFTTSKSDAQESPRSQE